MSSNELAASHVRRIRNTLALSQEELGRWLDVSPDAVKKWEGGARKCSGPARLLLLLLERSPTVLSLLDKDPAGLPSRNALEDSTEWFAFQRLLGVIEYWGRGVDRFAEIVDEEDLTHEWLLEQESAGVLRAKRGNHEIKEPTANAAQKYRLHVWSYWVKSQELRDSREIPLLNRQLLDTYTRLKAHGVPHGAASAMAEMSDEDVADAERARRVQDAELREKAAYARAGRKRK